MKVKTSELIGAALDWAVAKTLGYRYAADIAYQGIGKDAFLTVDKIHVCADWDDAEEWSPSTDWAQGGPIIERECVTIGGFNPGVLTWNAHQEGMYFMENCPTPLIAAMRCYVASKLGDEIDIPDELI